MIEVADLSKQFGSTTAVEGLSFTVRPGHVTGFLGPNGAGKSTTMRMMLGLDRPTRGTATFGGRLYTSLHRPLFQVGAVLDALAFHSGRSARDHLRCLAQSNGIGAARVDAMLELVGLSEVAGRRVGTYSLGMGQRLGLAAALLGDPPVLICDEPVNGLDPEGIVWIRTLLRSLAAEGRAVFVSSHLMSEMAITADHLVVIAQGRLIADATTADIIARSSPNQVFVRSPKRAQLATLLDHSGALVAVEPDPTAMLVTGPDCATIGDLAALHRIPVHELTPKQASLEAAYMHLTRDHVDFRTHPGEPAESGSALVPVALT